MERDITALETAIKEFIRQAPAFDGDLALARDIADKLYAMELAYGQMVIDGRRQRVKP